METVPAPGSSQPAVSAKLVPIGQLFTASFRPYKQHGKIIASLLALPLAAALLVFVPGISIFSSLAFSLLVIVTQISLIIVFQEGPRPWSELSRRSWKKFLPAFGLAILTGFMVFGGLSLLVIPGIYLMVSFSLATMILVIENIGGLTAILKSREYVRGSWFPVFGRLLVLFVVSIIISIVFNLPDLSNPENATPPLKSFLSSFSTLLILPFTTAYLFTIYRSLVASKPLANFVPSSKNRTWAIVLAVFGFIAIPLFLFVTLAFVVATIGSL